MLVKWVPCVLHIHNRMFMGRNSCEVEIMYMQDDINCNQVSSQHWQFAPKYARLVV